MVLGGRGANVTKTLKNRILLPSVSTLLSPIVGLTFLTGMPPLPLEYTSSFRINLSTSDKSTSALFLLRFYCIASFQALTTRPTCHDTSQESKE